jgi:hypothetical protein
MGNRGVAGSLNILLVDNNLRNTMVGGLDLSCQLARDVPFQCCEPCGAECGLSLGAKLSCWPWRGPHHSQTTINPLL